MFCSKFVEGNAQPYFLSGIKSLQPCTSSFQYSEGHGIRIKYTHLIYFVFFAYGKPG